MRHADPSPTSQLSPAQQRAFDDLLAAVEVSPVVTLGGDVGLGKSTLLRHLHAALGGTVIGARDLVAATGARHPLAFEEAFFDLASAALGNGPLLVDDLHVALHVALGHHMYPRLGYLAAALEALASTAAAGGTPLVGVSSFPVPTPLTARGVRANIRRFTAEDYAFFFAAFLGAERARAVDAAAVHRLAPKLNAHQLRNACAHVARRGAATTEQVGDYLRSQYLVSNVDLGEVQAVDLGALKGLDDVLEALEANVILPLENAELADEFGLKPKRGVLLAGPPGTGKTTVGRALAHRLRSKFFLIDGTFVSGSSDFFGRVHQVFEEAKKNAPAVIFIDDSDVIFQSGEEFGLYRYLLTMLDGLESRSVGQVCVMMTAMDVGNLPPALVRSGRVELWLETRLPDEAARRSILTERAAELPPPLDQVDVAALGAATADLSGADLKRLVDDAKLLFARDRALGRLPRPVTDYFLDAAATVRRNKERYAAAEASARDRQPGRGAMFAVPHSVFVTSAGFDGGGLAPDAMFDGDEVEGPS